MNTTPQNNPTNTLADDLVLKVENLSTHFVFKRRVAKAVRNVTFSIKKGKTLAIVGESGSGKSVTALSLMHLLAHPGQIASGQALYRTSNDNIIDLASVEEMTMRKIRGQEISMIFQEPMSSLNPLFTVGDQIGEMLSLHEDISKPDLRKRVIEMLELVEIPSAERRVDEYPHSMSGGMRQRVMIAMAMICNPAFLIADEPTTALDVTIQAQILDLMRKLQTELNMSILFITHDMGVVAEIADEVAVMYAGEIVEQAPVIDIFARPRHPYTKGLLGSIPGIDQIENGARLQAIPGTVPPLHDMPSGCAFAPRCQFASAGCEKPIILHKVTENHFSRCINFGDL
ncbi:MAG: ABC transporter ATP-binding protein [Alphaproteobacteria bacterium]|nr:ABC transporter ATP-binding protein [Alphaproteobacteria bacterium]